MSARNWRLVSFGHLAWLAACAGAAHGQVVVTAPGNPIVGIAASLGSNTSTLATAGGGSGNAYPTAESPPNAIDHILTDKYLNFQQSGAGFIVTPTSPSVLTGFRFATGNDAVERDPATITIEGTNAANATTTLNSPWTQVYSGVSGLATDPGRDTYGAAVSFANATSYTSYRVLIQSVRTPASANSFQFGEIDLTGTAVPEPTSLALVGLAVGALAVRRFRGKA